MCIRDSLNDGDEEVSALACCHSFHSYCLKTYAATTSTSVLEVKCPLCKLTCGELNNRDLTPTRLDLSRPASWLGETPVWEGHFDLALIHISEPTRPD